MKKILLVTGEFFPYLSANVNCMREILHGLQDAGYAIDVLTVVYDGGMPQQAQIDGCRVFRAEVTEYARIGRVMRESFLAKLPAIVKTVLLMFLFKGVNRVKMRRMRKLFFARMHGPYDRILSVAYPMESHHVACAIARRTKIPWVQYNLDPYAYNATLRKSTIGLRKAAERKWSAQTHAAVLSLGISEENARHGYDPYRGKRTLEIPLPNLVIGDDAPPQTAKAAGEKIVLRYTGTFYPDIRRPDELLRFLEKLDPERFVAEFYGECCEYLRDCGQEMPACVEIKKKVSIEECRRLTETADILVNVGNLCPNQVPSKVFEYIATGKPILNFYSSGSDSSLLYLNRYPALLSVRSAQEIGQDDLLKIYDGGRCIPAHTLRELYADCLRETVVQKFVDFFATE